MDNKICNKDFIFIFIKFSTKVSNKILVEPMKPSKKWMMQTSIETRSNFTIENENWEKGNITLSPAITAWTWPVGQFFFGKFHF